LLRTLISTAYCHPLNCVITVLNPQFPGIVTHRLIPFGVFFYCTLLPTVKPLNTSLIITISYCVITFSAVKHHRLKLRPFVTSDTSLNLTPYHHLIRKLHVYSYIFSCLLFLVSPLLRVYHLVSSFSSYSTYGDLIDPTLTLAQFTDAICELVLLNFLFC
jgi:hypothetical protein